MKGSTGFADDAVVSVRAVITDKAGNATTGTASAATITVDQTAPGNSSGYPKADTATSGGFTVHEKTDDDGTAYYVVVADGASVPSATQVKAGQNASGTAALKKRQFFSHGRYRRECRGDGIDRQHGL